MKRALAAGLLCAGTLAFFWPGVAMYDSVAQYQQVLSGAYDDWHPPVMARLWALLHLGWAGQAPMFALQILLYWIGLGLFAAALARRGAHIAAMGALALGLWPPFLGWQVEVLKDGQMAGALLAATGLAAWWRLQPLPSRGTRDSRGGGTMPRWTFALVALLLVYATLLRFNAMFATVPLGVALLGGARLRRPLPRAAAILAGFALVVAIGPATNHRLLGAKPSGVERALPTFDLAGIAHHAGPAAVPILPARLWQAAEARGCVTPLLWDPLADEDRCAFIANGLDEAAPGGRLFALWIETAARHPFAYAAHRLAHWNLSMRFWAPWQMPAAEPAATSEPNALGLGSPAPRIAPFQKLSGWLAGSPLGSPMLWLAVALTMLVLVRQPLASGLALSAVASELGLLLVGIASDYRYHLWAMLATGLAALSLAGAPVRRLAFAPVLLVGAIVVLARLTLQS